MWECWEEAGDLVTEWRHLYQMPRNDPRVLEADEDTILRDMLIHRIRRDRVEEALHPQVEDPNDPAVRARFAASAAHFVATEADKLRRLYQPPPAAEAGAKPKRMRWRVGGEPPTGVGSSGGRKP